MKPHDVLYNKTDSFVLPGNQNGRGCSFPCPCAHLGNTPGKKEHERSLTSIILTLKEKAPPSEILQYNILLKNSRFGGYATKLISGLKRNGNAKNGGSRKRLKKISLWKGEGKRSKGISTPFRRRMVEPSKHIRNKGERKLEEWNGKGRERGRRGKREYIPPGWDWTL